MTEPANIITAAMDGPKKILTRPLAFTPPRPKNWSRCDRLRTNTSMAKRSNEFGTRNLVASCEAMNFYDSTICYNTIYLILFIARSYP